METIYYIHNLYKKGFDFKALPSDLQQYANEVLKQPISIYNAKVELLDVTLFNAIKTLYPGNPIVQKVGNHTPTTEIDIRGNNGFNTPIDEQ